MRGVGCRWGGGRRRRRGAAPPTVSTPATDTRLAAPSASTDLTSLAPGSSGCSEGCSALLATALTDRGPAARRPPARRRPVDWKAGVAPPARCSSDDMVPTGWGPSSVGSCRRRLAARSAVAAHKQGRAGPGRRGRGWRGHHPAAAARVRWRGRMLLLGRTPLHQP